MRLSSREPRDEFRVGSFGFEPRDAENSLQRVDQRQWLREQTRVTG
jgi:hypothetical protein